ncbi:MAG: tRNA lysidine(34) synthetase TilS [Gemmatimonadota bacterium]
MLSIRFQEHLETLGLASGSRALVAVSGGGDSVALLDLLVATREAHGMTLIVAHVDHGIHPQSAEVAVRVEQLAQCYGLRCITGHIDLGGGASETRARRRRYEWLEESREREGAEFIFTAHHADDQVETVLLRVFHGSGPAGLAAMAPRRGAIVRPLLPFRRVELVQYLHERNLAYWEDPANRDPRHERSWLRETLIPHLRDRWPEVDQNVLRLADHARADRNAWDLVLDQLPGLAWRSEPGGGSVAAAVLGGYDSTLANTLLRAIARRAGCHVGPDRARRALRFLRAATSGTCFQLGNGWELQVVFDRIRIVPITEDRDTRSTGTKEVAITGKEGNESLGSWVLTWRVEMAPLKQLRDGFSAWFIPGDMHFRVWRAGDRVRPIGGRGSRLVVKCFQESRVPRLQREGWPVLVDPAGEVVWVPGVCRSDDRIPHGGSEALRVDAAVT